jgi:uncharacterized membrane protein YhhN
MLTLFCAAAVAALLFAEAKGHVALKRVFKATASVCFVAVAVFNATFPVGPVAALLIAGLLLGLLGDVALSFSGERAFLGGLVAFLLGHVAYVAAFLRLAPPEPWLVFPALGMAAFGFVVLRWLWPRLGSMKVPVTVYVAVICAMVVAAFGVLGTNAPARILVALGAALFAASDLAVARERFVDNTLTNKLWGLPTYYAGQLCIAWAVGAVA